MKRRTVFIILLLVPVIIYTILRTAFLLKYYDSSSIAGKEITQIFLFGARMDIAGVLYVNAPFILLYLATMPWIHRTVIQAILGVVYLLLNLPFLALNIIDLEYFGFNGRRSTIDILYLFKDSAYSFPSLIKQYYFLLVIFILTAIAIYLIVFKIFRSANQKPVKEYLPDYILIVAILIICSLTITENSKRPLTPASPLLHFQASYQPLANNSTISFLYSLFRFNRPVKKINYLPDATAQSIFPVWKQYHQIKSFENKNVVLIILESMSESLLKGENKASVKFLDSIMQRSIVFTNTFQNGGESVKGLTAILASIPPFTDVPFFTSPYAGIPIEGIGSILNKKGYSTSFFLGAEYDHFNFAKLVRIAGINNYYSANHYNNSGHFDGNWGIYDEYFFQYFAKEISKIQQPFFTVLYNISTHPPFKLPPHRAKSFTITGQTPQQNAVSYSDYCLQQLFDSISREDWFNNTIFVFTADHSLPVNEKSKKFRLMDALRIPFFIYDPSNPEYREISGPWQQLDIVPTILDMLHYDGKFVSFGNSALRGDQKFSITRLNEIYQLIDSTSVIGFDDQSGKLLYHYQYNNDTELVHNIANLSADTANNILLLKSIIQQFNNALYRNSFVEE